MIRRRKRISCGVGFIADIKGRKSHKIVEDALTILLNLEHRGAVGADPRAGDGAGILVQIPHKFFAKKAAELGFTLPEPGHYAVGALFMPHDEAWRRDVLESYAEVAEKEGMKLLGWRNVPTDNSTLGASVKPTEPVNMQVFIARNPKIASEDEFERRLYILRKTISGSLYGKRERSVSHYYPVSISCRTMIYKGMFLADQLGAYYPDLHDPDFESALALVHQRFSTNTFPAWSLAHPYRMVAHNGEINTLRGNNNWMAARQASVSSPKFGDDIKKLWPISYEGQSDTACFDNALEFLVMGGYSLAHAMMMLIPEAWAGNQLMTEKRRNFYEYNAALMEPWDGPAAIAFTDGRQIGATLDRNGLRPARYLVTRDDRIIMASENGVLAGAGRRDRHQVAAAARQDAFGRPREGPAHSRRRDQVAIGGPPPLRRMAQEHANRARGTAVDVGSGADLEPGAARSPADVRLHPGRPENPDDADGDDRRRGGRLDGQRHADLGAVRKSQAALHLFQAELRAGDQPADRSDPRGTGDEPCLHHRSAPEPVRPRRHLEDQAPRSPSADPDQRQFGKDPRHLRDRRKPFQVDHARHDLAGRCRRRGHGSRHRRICAPKADVAVRDGINIIILSDRRAGADRIPIPSLLACAAVHHHLIREGLRTSVGIVVESGEPREVHHFACLAGYGAEAINPYLAFETLIAMKGELPQKLDDKELIKRYIKSIDKGLLKVMSKMGISTYQSYCGAQIFDAIGLKSDFVAKYFTGTATRIEGVGLAEIAEEAVRRHRDAFGDAPIYRSMLDVGGDYAFRVRGEDHVWNAATVSALQHAVRGNSAEKYRQFARIINDQTTRLLTIRGLFRIKSAAEDGRKPVPIEEVEPAKEIVKRFSTGAMSYGSISREAHTTLAIAMNRIGGKSNTGEGGEESDRYKPMPNGDSMRSAIKQVASGRFGVTAEYLVNSDMMQIKIAQGAKPGEGGQLPGHKVDKTIAKVRHSTPGVGLISPPPHHDIYSIEDLAQLIFDLKNVNPDGDVSVKLVSEVGVGTVAAGVSKARSDHVTIAGYEGGTGAAPLTSVKHAGSPWEIGLAETHQTLVANRLRGRICVQVDGGIRTGRDVVVGALLGADEFGFATAPLIAAGCIMMRKCHLNTCPVGVATQDPVLRKRFTGQPEHVINYFFFVAEEVRELMAGAGLPQLRRDDRPDADVRPAKADRARQGERARFLETVHQARRAAGRRDLQQRSAGPQDRTTSSTAS